MIYLILFIVIATQIFIIYRFSNLEKMIEKKVGGEKEKEWDEDELLRNAKEIILRAREASASLLQRELKIGYAHAARILDILEEQGFIGPADGAKPRDVVEKE